MPDRFEPRAILDGAAMPLAQALVPVVDAGFARGDGVFETVGVWAGRPFALRAHLDRLARSLELAHLDPVDPGLIEAEVASLLTGVGGDGALRVYVTASGTRLVTLDRPPDRPRPDHLVVQTAPWIAASGTGSPGGPKTMSYLPNMAASRAARRAGANDALLVTPDGVVLEGATFSVLWVIEGVVHAPDLGLGIIDSISRRALLAIARTAGMEVAEGRWPAAALEEADEVLAVSSLRDVVAVRRIGELALPQAGTPIRDLLSDRLRAARRAGTWAGGPDPMP